MLGKIKKGLIIATIVIVIILLSSAVFMAICVDQDNDGVWAIFDIDDNVDVITAIQLQEFVVYDKVDSSWRGSGAEIYFMIKADGKARKSPVLTQNAYEGRIPTDFTFVYNVPDDQRSIEIRIALYDKDFITIPYICEDKLDISDSGEMVDITYNLESGSWDGDTNTNISAGEEASITFEIFDNVGQSKEIDILFSEMGIENGLEVYHDKITKKVVSFLIEGILEFCLDKAGIFTIFGGYGSLISLGLGILGVIVFLYYMLVVYNI